jgi:hypothetical protein
LRHSIVLGKVGRELRDRVGERGLRGGESRKKRGQNRHQREEGGMARMGSGRRVLGQGDGGDLLRLLEDINRASVRECEDVTEGSKRILMIFNLILICKFNLVSR